MPHNPFFNSSCSSPGRMWKHGILVSHSRDAYERKDFSEPRLLLRLLSRFSRVWLCATPQTAAHQAPLSLGFSRQEHWSGLPFPSPMQESKKRKWSHWGVSNSPRPHGLQPTRLLRPWDLPDKSTGVGCHCLLWDYIFPYIEKALNSLTWHIWSL